MTKIYLDRVPYTRRQKVIMIDGTPLERQMIYMSSDTWEALSRLCAKTDSSCSRVIARLIKAASPAPAARFAARKSTLTQKETQ